MAKRKKKAAEENPTARGASRDALHEQFLQIIQEHCKNHRMPVLETIRDWSR